MIAIALATMMQSVLDLMLYSYAFMVSGLLIPVLGTLVYKNPSSTAAMVSMISGGSLTLILILINIDLPFGLDANFFGITVSAITYLMIQNKKQKFHAEQ